MRIGYFGGSFDPPHRGHLHVALAAAERFGLERVLLAPTGSQPFKPDGAAASFADRLEMVRLLVEEQERVVASELDEPHDDGAPNYTVEALERLRGTLDGDDEIFVILGIDAFLDIREWREPERLFELAEWIVVSRPGYDLSMMDEIGLGPREHRRLHALPDVVEDISATELRAMLRDGPGGGSREVEGLVPHAVLAYIRERGLYR